MTPLDSADEEAIRDRRRRMEDKFGKGTYEEAISKLKPHRCAGHLEDFMVGATTLPLNILPPFGLFLSCLMSKEGQEPLRVYYKPPEPFAAHKTSSSTTNSSS